MEDESCVVFFKGFKEFEYFYNMIMSLDIDVLVEGAKCTEVIYFSYGGYYERGDLFCVSIIELKVRGFDEFLFFIICVKRRIFVISVFFFFGEDIVFFYRF